MLIYGSRPHPTGTNKAARLYLQADNIELRCPCPGDDLILAMTVVCEEISSHREKRLNSAPGASGPALGVGVKTPCLHLTVRLALLSSASGLPMGPLR